MTNYVHARLFLAAMFAAPIIAGTAFMGAAGHAVAQDAVPGTPDELKDFKLDPEKAPPVRQPVPTTEPVVMPPVPNPPAARTPVIEVPAQVPKARAPAARTPVVKPVAKSPVKPDAVKSAAVKTNAAAAADVGNDAAVQDADADLPAPPPAELPTSEQQALQTQAGQPETPRPEAIEPGAIEPASSVPWNYILAALLAVIGASAGGFGAAIFFRRRRSSHVDASEAIFEPMEKPADGHNIVVSDEEAKLATVAAPIIPTPITPTLIIPAPVSVSRPKLDISFVPEKASISLANLTIKGRLHIINNGADDAAAMQLNAAVISASAGQGQAISRYFSSALPPGKDLGAAKVGEQIALEMDLMIPIADLQTFVMGKQKLLVPIILARVEYQWSDGTQHGAQHGAKHGTLHSDEAQLSCLIGREASPPKSKMGALRLDLGPRSFASLGQRPLPG